MDNEEELDDFGRHPKLWTVSAVTWRLENPDYGSRISLGVEIDDPAKEVEITHTLETVEAPDLDHALPAAHALLDRHAEQIGEYGLELWLYPPQLPHAEQERLGIQDYKLTPEALKQARAIGLNGRLAYCSQALRHHAGRRLRRRPRPGDLPPAEDRHTQGVAPRRWKGPDRRGRSPRREPASRAGVVAAFLPGTVGRLARQSIARATDWPGN